MKRPEISTIDKKELDLAARIDHTILQPDTSFKDVSRMCEEAIEYGFASVCVPPYYVNFASKILKNQLPKVTTVVGFPMGYSCTPAKVEETRKAINDGASEIDMVINISAVKQGDWSYVKNDINSVSTLAKLLGQTVKVILEAGILNEEEIIKSIEICNEVEPDFVKTNTGFLGHGANLETIILMRKHLDAGIKIKASGGIKTRKMAMELIKAGADRIGTSSGLKLLK